MNRRHTAEYKAAVDESYIPYQACVYYEDPEIDDDYYVCFFQFGDCKRVFKRDELTPAHIFGVGAHYDLLCEPLDIVPGCPVCHFLFDDLTRDEKNEIIEEKLPGRIALLERLIKERSCKVEVI